MLSFEVSLNGQPLCTAGVGDAGVLTAIVSAVLRGAGSGAGETELTLSVGGLAAGEHRWWPGAEVLAVGDEVVIRVVESAAPDAPARVQRADPAGDAVRERAYYERLRAKYEGR